MKQLKDKKHPDIYRKLVLKDLKIYKIKQGIFSVEFCILLMAINAEYSEFYILIT